MYFTSLEKYHLFFSKLWKQLFAKNPIFKYLWLSFILESWNEETNAHIYIYTHTNIHTHIYMYMHANE